MNACSLNTRPVRAGAWTVALAGAFLALSFLTGSLQAQEVGVAARVNGVEISVFRLNRHFEDYLKLQGRDPGMMRDPRVYNRLKGEALDQLINKELLRQEAQRLEIEVSDEAVQEVRASVEAGFHSADAFQRRIEASGFDDASYDDYLREDLAAALALNTLIGQIPISEEEVRNAYEANQDAFVRLEEVRARHILIRRPPDAAEAALAEQRVAELLARIEAGEDFSELAREYSEDSSAEQGGDLGYFGRGRMVAPFEEVAFALAPGEVGGPVATQFGWHLIRVEDHRAEGPLPEAEALDLVRAYFFDVRRAEVQRSVLDALRQDAEIEVLLDL